MLGDHAADHAAQVAHAGHAGQHDGGRRGEDRAAEQGQAADDVPEQHQDEPGDKRDRNRRHQREREQRQGDHEL